MKPKTRRAALRRRAHTLVAGSLHAGPVPQWTQPCLAEVLHQPHLSRDLRGGMPVCRPSVIGLLTLDSTVDPEVILRPGSSPRPPLLWWSRVIPAHTGTSNTWEARLLTLALTVDLEAVL